VKFCSSAPELPAATTNVTPAAVPLQIAMWSASPVVRPQLSVETPEPPRDMLATVMSLFGSASVRVEVTQSIPQMTPDVRPEPFASSTRTAHSFVPGATPTAPVPLFFAAIVPATWVPWPFWSFVSPATQLLPATALRSGWVRLMPVSMTATFTGLASDTVWSTAAPVRRTPVGMLSPVRTGTRPVAFTGRSGVTKATRGSSRRSATSWASSFAEKPCTTPVNVCVALTSASRCRRVFVATVAAFVDRSSTTM
jgi:hypothetical protein